MWRALSLLRAGLWVAASCAMGACATTPGTENPRDPLERINRAVFNFNEAVDVTFAKPVASAYRAILPELVRTGITNAFGNLGDAWSAVNQLLQGKPQQAAEMCMRFGTNTVFGLGGLLDPASELGLERRTEDFGQTLGHWGVGNGAYLVLPLVGPSTLRDLAAFPIDFVAAPPRMLRAKGEAAALWVLQLVSNRAGLLDASKMIDDLALDKYTFVRDGWLARRRNQIYDGDPPDEPEPEEPK